MADKTSYHQVSSADSGADCIKPQPISEDLKGRGDLATFVATHSPSFLSQAQNSSPFSEKNNASISSTPSNFVFPSKENNSILKSSVPQSIDIDKNKLSMDNNRSSENKESKPSVTSTGWAPSSNAPFSTGPNPFNKPTPNPNSGTLNTSTIKNPIPASGTSLSQSNLTKPPPVTSNPVSKPSVPASNPSSNITGNTVHSISVSQTTKTPVPGAAPATNYSFVSKTVSDSKPSNPAITKPAQEAPKSNITAFKGVSSSIAPTASTLTSSQATKNDKPFGSAGLGAAPKDLNPMKDDFKTKSTLPTTSGNGSLTGSSATTAFGAKPSVPVATAPPTSLKPSVPPSGVKPIEKATVAPTSLKPSVPSTGTNPSVPVATASSTSLKTSVPSIGTNPSVPVATAPSTTTKPPVSSVSGTNVIKPTQTSLNQPSGQTPITKPLTTGSSSVTASKPVVPSSSQISSGKPGLPPTQSSNNSQSHGLTQANKSSDLSSKGNVSAVKPVGTAPQSNVFKSTSSVDLTSSKSTSTTSQVPLTKPVPSSIGQISQTKPEVSTINQPPSKSTVSGQSMVSISKETVKQDSSKQTPSTTGPPLSAKKDVAPKEITKPSEPKKDIVKDKIDQKVFSKSGVTTTETKKEPTKDSKVVEGAISKSLAATDKDETDFSKDKSPHRKPDDLKRKDATKTDPEVPTEIKSTSTKDVSSSETAKKLKSNEAKSTEVEKIDSQEKDAAKSLSVSSSEKNKTSPTGNKKEDKKTKADVPETKAGVKRSSDEVSKKTESKKAAPAKKSKAGSLNEIPDRKDIIGEIFICGKGASYQLGLSKKSSEIKEPSRLENMPSNVVDISSGQNHTLALTSEGDVYSWGDNSNCALGRDGDQFKPSKIAFEDEVEIVQIAAGNSFSAALDSSGKVYAWGTFLSDDEVLGFFESPGTSQETPIRIGDKLPKGTEFTNIAAGRDHMLLLTTKGRVYAIGDMKYGQLGVRILRQRDGDDIPQGLRLNCISLTNVVQIVAGGYHSFAVNKKDEVFSWGQNNYYQCGISSESLNYDTTIELPTKTVSIMNLGDCRLFAGAYHTLALNEEGELYGFGLADDGLIGVPLDKTKFADLEGKKVLEEPEHILFPNSAEVELVAVGSRHSFVYAGSKLYSWGSEISASGHSENKTVPTSITTLDSEKIIKLSAGKHHSVFLVANSDTMC